MRCRVQLHAARSPYDNYTESCAFPCAVLAGRLHLLTRPRHRVLHLHALATRLYSNMRVTLLTIDNRLISLSGGERERCALLSEMSGAALPHVDVPLHSSHLYCWKKGINHSSFSEILAGLHVCSILPAAAANLTGDIPPYLFLIGKGARAYLCAQRPHTKLDHWMCHAGGHRPGGRRDPVAARARRALVCTTQGARPVAPMDTRPGG